MNSGPTSIHGSCHCGNLEVVFETGFNADELPIRACACSFCRSQGARSTSDPKGSVKITIHDPSRLIRYRFALKTADFLICGRCGIYVAAVIKVGDKSYATLNINTFDDLERFKREAVPVHYGKETAAQRIARRKTNWTPVASFKEG